MKEEVEAWKKRDPIVLFERQLIEKKLLTDAKKTEVAAAITKEIDEAVEFAEQSPYPEASELMDHIWG